MTRRAAPVAALLVVIALLATFIYSAVPAGASFHEVRIREVFAGADGAQFIELQMYSAGQGQVQGASVRVFNATGQEVGSFVFANNMSIGANQASMLVATPAAETRFGVPADLEMTAVIPAAGGKICFAGTIDCVAWGNYSGPATGSGTPFAATTGLPADQSMERKISGGTNPSALDHQDDTDNSAADFQLAPPSPRNNAGVTGGASPTPDPSTSPSPSTSASPTPDPTPIGDPPPPLTRITRPGNAGPFRAGRLTQFRGTAESNFGGTITVFIALKRQKTDGRCSWWAGSRFEPGPCNAVMSNMLQATGGEEWSYRLSRVLGSSIGTRTRNYTLFSSGRCTCSPFTESSFQRGRNRVTFEIR